ncbi:MAG TPA: M3 family metallopeptidase [Anaeromyxobacteraceae bacterium]|nr:M3 family metallopeptidase [Anaeromyxobacteraceae bacterium]
MPPVPPPESSRLLAGPPQALLAACREAVRRAREGAARLAALPAPAPRDEALELFDEAFALLADAGARASLARSVHPDAAMRTAAETAEQEVESAQAALSLDPGLYGALSALDAGGADAATRWLLEKSLRDFRRAGVDRDPATRARVQALREELTRIGQDFARHIKDDVRSLGLDPAELEGLPDDWRRARPAGPDGKVKVTTDPTDLVPFMTYARSERAREALWRLSRQRGHPANLETLPRLLGRRAELARLLGYPSWAEYAAEDKMVGGEAAAAEFVAGIARAAEGRMRRDQVELTERKRRDEPGAALQPWDGAFLAERLKSERHRAGSQAARPYLEYRRVRDGLLDLTGRLFGIEWRRVGDAPIWHPEVEVFDASEGGRLLGRIYLDMHPRDGKYKHFAQFTLATGKRGARLPEGALVCNFPRPGSSPALLEHGDLRTFLHELGHLVHHLLGGQVRWAAQSGVATEWDFVEAPSQLLEEWAWDPEVLAGFARHVETGEPIPADLVRRMKAADETAKGLGIRQQTYYAALSLELHRRDPAGLDTTRLAAELYEAHTPFRHVEGTWPEASFGHLESYSALYYTYLWSLVIAKDLFTVFRREGLLSGAARRYRKAVLEPGGSRKAAELVQDFLGRPHGFEAFRAWLDAG